MTFDNSKTIISLRLKLFAATVLLLIFIVLTYVGKIIKYPLLGMSDSVWTLTLVGIYILILILPLYLNYQYIYFSDEGGNIIFRYFTSGLIGGKKNSVEISKNTFSGFKTEKRLFGRIESIILFQRFNEGIAKYPPIYISALTREEKVKIYKSLTSYLPKL